jgi:L-lysine exporter family protein LysE/ArgO
VDAFRDGWLLSLSLCLDLGIVNLAIIRAGITRGVPTAFLIGLGSCVGDIIWAGLAGAGVAALLRYAAVRYVLWAGGTIALCYLTIQMVRQAIRPSSVNIQRSDAPVLSTARYRGAMRDFANGVLLALASPSAILWFAAVGGSLIATSVHLSTELGLAMFYGGFFLQGMIWSLAVAVLASSTGRALGPRLVRWASIASGALFAWFAVRVFVSGLPLLD